MNSVENGERWLADWKKFGRENDSDWLRGDGAIFFFFSSNNDETLKREKLFELEVFLKVYLFYYQGYLLKLSEENKIT